VPSLAILVAVVFDFILQTDRITEVEECYTHATTGGDSNDDHDKRKRRPILRLKKDEVQWRFSAPAINRNGINNSASVTLLMELWTLPLLHCLRWT